MSSKNLLTVLTASAALFATSQTGATLLLHENFEGYSQGAINGVAETGTGVTGSWSDTGAGTFNVVAGLEGSNALQSTPGSAGDNVVSIAHTVPGWGTGQFWMSFLFSEQAYDGHFYVSPANNYPGGVGHGWWGGGLLGLHNTANPGFTYTPGDTHRMVVLYDFTGGTDTATLWVDPATDPVVAGTTPDASLAENLGASQTLWINAYGGTTSTVDDIRIGTEFADVIPEPTSLALLGLGGLLAARRRRA